jgi:hypothetical protein
MTGRDAVATVVAALAALSPRRHGPDPELVRALALLGWGDAETYRRAADGGVVVVVGLGAVAAVAGGPLPAVAAGTLLAGVAVHECARVGPSLLASGVRRRALGAAPWLVCRAAMRLRVSPSVEAAAEVAARDPMGPLERAFAAAVRRSHGTAGAGFDGLLDEWGVSFPPLERGVRLLTGAARAPDEARDRAIDRALAAVLDGVEERAAADAAGLRGPVTAVYAFGVLLPLAFVAALPATRVAGLPVSVPVVVAVYDILLPVGLLAATAWLLSRRPVAFPATRIPASHPDVPDRRWPALVAGAGVAVVAYWLAPAVLPVWTPPVAAAGFGLGSAATLHFRSYRSVRASVEAVEAGLPDVLFGVGRRVTDGDPVETALVETAADLESPAGELFGDAARRAAALGVGVETALVGEFGVLVDHPSRRTEDVARLLVDAVREGRAAGPALVAAGDHLSDLATVETSVRRSLRRATGTMGNTAAVFAPLVGGVTVALAAEVGGSRLGEALPQAALALAVGGYVLVLAALLTALATGLERGFDRALVGYRVGLALLAATATYLVAVVAGGLVA